MKEMELKLWIMFCGLCKKYKMKLKLVDSEVCSLGNDCVFVIF